MTGRSEGQGVSERPHKLPRYLVAETLPPHVRDAGRLLDANIMKEEHARQLPRDHWYEAIKDRKLCRIPVFHAAYAEACKLVDGDRKAVFRARLHDVCSNNARNIEGSSSRFAVTQIDDAETGALLTFDRAVVIVFSFNEIIVSEIERLKKGGDVEYETAAALRAVLLAEHCVSISCFYFAEMRDAVAAAVKHYGGDRETIEAVMVLADQPYDVIRDLLAPSVVAVPKRGTDKEVQHCGSYPTLRRIYKALESVDAIKAKLDRVPRDRHIQRLHVGIGNKTALQSERLVAPQAITRPPYEWGKPGPQGPWPSPEDDQD